MNSNTKKRRVDEGGSGGEQSNGGGLVHEELIVLSSHMNDMKSTMDEMKEHSRLQTQNMTNMMQMMQGMQGEIARLTNECIEMKNTMQTIQGLQHVHSEQITHNTKSVNSRFDVVDDKQNYDTMEVLLKNNQQWKYSAPRPSGE